MIFAGMFYAATLLLLVGLVYKIVDYSRTPAPLKIPTTPAPITQTGVVYRMAKEVVLFESLFKSNKWIWVFGWLFHFGLFLVLARHLRYFTEPVWFWVGIIQPFGKYASFMMVVGLAGLLARRFLVDRVRYISTPSDYLMLVLLIAIGLSGMLMTFVVHTDIGHDGPKTSLYFGCPFIDIGTHFALWSHAQHLDAMLTTCGVCGVDALLVTNEHRGA